MSAVGGIVAEVGVRQPQRNRPTGLLVGRQPYFAMEADVGQVLNDLPIDVSLYHDGAPARGGGHCLRSRTVRYRIASYGLTP